MAYRIKAGRNLTGEVRRIAAEQTRRALADLRRLDDRDVVDAVHDARKRCKKVRGLVRLVRPALGDRYGEANATYRDAARALSGARDAHALLETFDRLVATAGDDLPDGGLGSIRAVLEERRDRSTAELDGDDDRVAEAIELLSDGARHIESWTLAEDGWEAIGPGVQKTYGRGVEALAAAEHDPSPERFHELRKRAKYTWYHARLLRDLGPSVMNPVRKRFSDLSDALGDAHDLAVLQETLRDDHDAGPELPPALAYVEERRRDLERRSLRLAHRLYAEPPERFTERIGRYWACWLDDGGEPEVGSLEDVADSRRG